MEKTASTPIQLFRGMTADELAALRAAHCIRVQRYGKNALIYHAGRVVHEIGIVRKRQRSRCVLQQQRLLRAML